MTYTHPDFQRKGVASALYEHLFAEAKQAGIHRLYVEASLISKAFLSGVAFQLLKRIA